MGIFTRDRTEKVVEYHHYPEASFISHRPRLAFWYRFALGRPLDNIRWTNSTFWAPGSRGEPHWWLRLAGYQRLLFRLLLLWLALITLPVIGLALLGQSALLLQVAYAHLAAAAPVLVLIELHSIRERGLRMPLPLREQAIESARDEVAEEELAAEETPGRRVWRMVTLIEGRRDWVREVVEPLAMALADTMDNVYRSGDTDWITVPRNYLVPGGGKVEILLPTGFSGGMEAKRRIIEKTVAAKLAMMEPSYDWQVGGRHPRLLVSAPPVPPKVAPYSEYADLLRSTTEQYRPVLGVGATRSEHGELVSAEMVDASPHMALSAGTGAGKSMLMRSIIMQVLSWGWSVIILDWKAESHEWAKGLPGVLYVTTEQGIHDMGVRIAEEIDIRKALSKEERARRPRTLVVREEWNMTAALLARYWSALRSTAEQEERRTMPLRSPALSGFESLDFAGRSFGLFDFLAAQRMSNRVFNGNTDARENFMIRIMARYTPQTFRMLIPEVKPIRKPKELGRWLVWAQDEITFVQALLISDEEAREFATSGIPPAPSPWSTGIGARAAAGRNPSVALGDELRPDATGRSDRPAIEAQVLKPLRELADDVEHLGITYQMVRNAARADGRGDRYFPPADGGNQFSGYLYDAKKVQTWARQKRAAEAAQKEVNGS